MLQTELKRLKSEDELFYRRCRAPIASADELYRLIVDAGGSRRQADAAVNKYLQSQHDERHAR